MTTQPKQNISSVLITGASSGIGQQLAKDYLANGWQVFGCGRNAARLQAIEGIEPLVFDISIRESVVSAGKRLANLLNGQVLDLIILNAGTCEYINRPQEFDDILFERVVHTNLIGMGYCLHSFLPSLARDGRLALMSSSATYIPLPRAEAYGASKAAINYLAKSLAVSFSQQAITENIKVSLICPGFVKTPLTDKNNFPMPMCISVEQASKIIRNSLAKGKKEIHFPFAFTLMLKLLNQLPFSWWQKINRRLVNKHSANVKSTR